MRVRALSEVRIVCCCMSEMVREGEGRRLKKRGNMNLRVMEEGHGGRGERGSRLS